MNHPWKTILERAIAAFRNQYPSGSIEDQCARFYAQHPAALVDIIKHVSEQHRAGRIHNPWGVVRAEVQKRINNPTTIGSTAELDDRFALQQAETWMKNAGHQFPTWGEVEDELFERIRLDRTHEQHMRDLYDNLTATATEEAA